MLFEHTMLDDLITSIRACKLCSERFVKTQTKHAPRPVIWVGSNKPRILIAGQAPGARVHASGKPFTDPSGDRLRDWMGVGEDIFYDKSQVAILPMAFCFPGYDARGADLPPPAICAKTWRAPLINAMGNAALTLVIGKYAQDWHLGKGPNVRDRVLGWADHAPNIFPLPHPSWRNTAWLKKNPWFEAELLPALRQRVTKVLQ